MIEIFSPTDRLTPGPTHCGKEGRKVCTHCKKRRGKQFFCREKRRPDGFASICKDCQRKKMQGYRARVVKTASKAP